MDWSKLPQYEVIEQRYMKEQASDGYLIRHKKSGARLFLIVNDDTNRVFNIVFRTVPSDSTGVAHIIEHTVLCGSDKYPVKDPFMELAKGSLNTFLNAMTYPDKTMYPVASTNEKDFHNLMQVYMDAVFHPNILKTDMIFRQEGWHYELEDRDGELTYNGVVYNEMKGAFSSADDVLNRCVEQTLFPDTVYGNESGGYPECIPELTYEKYLEFYRRFYHPSNSYIYLYGSLDMEKILLWMDEEYLSRYDVIDPQSDIVPQKPFEEMKEAVTYYSVTEEEAEETGNYFAWNKVTGTNLDQKECYAFEVLETVLLNSPGAPLKKVLQDNEIGDDVYGGFENGIYHTSFQVIAKDAEPEQKELFVQLIEDTLRGLVKNGISRRSLLAAINSLEFKMREGDFGRWPKGLMIGLQLFDTWLYDEKDPFSPLAYEEILTFLREQMNTGYFEQLIEEKLLNNPFGAVISAEPVIGMTENDDKKRAEKLKAYKESLSEEEIDRLIAETKALRAYQEEPTPEELLETIPVLELSDISRDVLSACNSERKIGDTKVLFHPLFTSGIGYLECIFRVDFLPAKDLPYLALLRSFYGNVDTEHYSYQELSDEVNVYTGEIAVGYLQRHPIDNEKEPILGLGVRMKALYENLRKGIELALEMVLHSDFSDDKRLKEIISENRSRLKEDLLQSGHITAVNRAGSYGDLYSYLTDLTSGIGYYEFIDELYHNFDSRKEELRAKLADIICRLFTKEHLLISYTADEEGYQVLENCCETLTSALNDTVSEKVKICVPFERKNEGICSASQIQFVARVGSFVKNGNVYNGSMAVLKNILANDYLWKNLRDKGGAYGCMCGFGKEGTGYFVSYLDPHLERTNQVYEALPEYVGNFDASERDMKKHIIGTISELDVPLNPKARGSRGLQMYLCGITEELLRKTRGEILNTTVEDIRGLKGHMQAIIDDNYLCAVGNEGKLKAGKALFKELRQL